jgi:hypothetical protein
VITFLCIKLAYLSRTQTRSGSEFPSGEAGRIIAPASATFDFEQLYEEVAHEGENPDGDDTEGYQFEPITT